MWVNRELCKGSVKGRRLQHRGEVSGICRLLSLNPGHVKRSVMCNGGDMGGEQLWENTGAE